MMDGVFEPLAEIPGTVPPLDRLGQGCAFAARCDFSTDACLIAPPALHHVTPETAAACLYPVQS
jgi:oligopeptide/dipeptide ABC transporter ATP-binding protein